MNVVVTGGGTIAPIDDVRLMTNISSGRFAAAITEAVSIGERRSGTSTPFRPSFRSGGSARFDLELNRSCRRARTPRATAQPLAIDRAIASAGPPADREPSPIMRRP